MPKKTFISHAGYTGALAYILLSVSLVYLHARGLLNAIDNRMIFAMAAAAFLLMLLSEYIEKSLYNRRHGIRVTFQSLSPSIPYLLRSTFFRFSVLLIPLLLTWFIIHNHAYFVRDRGFDPTRELFDYLLWTYLIAGPVYIFVTLRLRGGRRYEFNDYAVLAMIGLRSLGRQLLRRNGRRLYRNRRIKKIFLLYLVTFFWLTLMGRFLVQEFQAFSQQLHIILSGESGRQIWFEQVRHWYFVLFHLLFVIDVGIALIGYSFASRWLDNRTKSVDTTPLGWFVALACYPPFNSFISEHFVFYNGLDTHQIITSQWAITVVLALLIPLYTVYVWATVALGFKFSNLTNRGIIDSGPYRYVRHPAYAAKNLAWLIDYTYVYTNIWATLAFFLWNGIYVLRALTEERHLKNDPDYRVYCHKVSDRFIPGVV